MNMHKMIFVLGLAAIVGGSVTTASFAAPPGVVTISVAPSDSMAKGPVTFMYDDATVKPMPLPMANTAPVAMSSYAARPFFSGPPGFSPGSLGSGVMSPVNLSSGASAPDMASSLGLVSPQEFGTSNHPFTTARVDLIGTPANEVSKRFPYRATGKLYFKIGTGNYVCSASLIKRGVIVTAAHCVTKFGGTLPRWYSSWQYVPARYDTLAPYGIWNATSPWVMAVYYNGTDSCAPGSPGVVCRNDIAVLKIVPQSGAYPGTQTGWYSYGWNGYGFSNTNLALINQLGYPVSHDAGLRMQRTDSQGFVSNMVGNTVWGSRQTGGSSGGPELVNLGPIATLSGTSLGAEAAANTVVGVTSWGYVGTSQVIKQMGASAFVSTNIPVLVAATCPTATTPGCF